jgi:hypothetical protein
MIVTIQQLEHLPRLGFLHRAAQADVLVLLDVARYRESYQNKALILADSLPVWVSIPVLPQTHAGATMRDVEIDNSRPWAKEWTAALERSYSHTAYFSENWRTLGSIGLIEWPYLADLNEHIIRHLLAVFGIRCRVLLASGLALSGKRSSLFLDICKKTAATTYLSGHDDDLLLDEGLFDEAGIGVRHHEWCSNLSSVDFLFRHGESAGRRLLLGNDVCCSA